MERAVGALASNQAVFELRRVVLEGSVDRAVGFEGLCHVVDHVGHLGDGAETEFL